MIAGPIKRYENFSENITEKTINSNDILEGLFRIILGFVKKIVIADNMNTLIEEIGNPSKTQNVILLSGAVFLYGFRIYFDFSGYSDIAIGSSRLFGIIVPENFHFPYLRKNITDFWRHWHISLYSWLVDYVYIPLGGSRVQFLSILLNILITMLISGIWHGAAWNFVLWGIWHGTLLVIHKVYVDKVKPFIKQDVLNSKLYAGCSYFLTMASVWFGWSMFMWSINDLLIYWNAIIRQIL
jgi:alginate O-acetyltransferase complex protein AlgI